MTLRPACLTLCLIAAAALHGAGPATADAGASAIPADSIIAHYYAAIGGHAALIADTTLVFSGHYQEGSFKAQTTILWKRPNLRRVSVIGPDGFAYVEIFDGQHEWEFSESFAQPVKRDTGAAERAGRRGAEFDQSFVDYRSKGHHVESMGSSTLDGRHVNELRVTLGDGWAKEYYFDAATGLLIAIRKAMPLHAVGGDVESLSFLRDYRRVGTVLRPFAEEERNVATGKVMNRLQWDVISSDRPVRDAAFAPPER